MADNHPPYIHYMPIDRERFAGQDRKTAWFLLRQEIMRIFEATPVNRKEDEHRTVLGVSGRLQIILDAAPSWPLPVLGVRHARPGALETFGPLNRDVLRRFDRLRRSNPEFFSNTETPHVRIRGAAAEQ